MFLDAHHVYVDCHKSTSHTLRSADDPFGGRFGDTDGAAAAPLQPPTLSAALSAPASSDADTADANNVYLPEPAHAPALAQSRSLASPPNALTSSSSSSSSTTTTSASVDETATAPSATRGSGGGGDGNYGGDSSGDTTNTSSSTSSSSATPTSSMAPSATIAALRLVNSRRRSSSSRLVVGLLVGWVGGWSVS